MPTVKFIIEARTDAEPSKVIYSPPKLQLPLSETPSVRGRCTKKAYVEVDRTQGLYLRCMRLGSICKLLCVCFVKKKKNFNSGYRPVPTDEDFCFDVESPAPAGESCSDPS